MKDAFRKPNLFDFMDYRAYLKSWFESAKKTSSSISFRKFSEMAGFKSTNFIMLVLQGKRNLSEEAVLKTARALKLNKQETEFFKNLVLYNQADSHEKKDHFYRQLLRSKKYQSLQPILPHQYEYCSRWYHSAIRELAASREFDGTPRWIADRLFPPVSPSEIEHSLSLLLKLGFLTKDEEGRYQQCHTRVSTGAETASVAVFNYHFNLLDLAKVILERLPAERRDISALTLGVLKSRVPQLKQMIQNFRQEVLKLVAEDDNPEEVVQINIQMFPLTREEGILTKEEK
ncbi:MAG: TIGR02147 family protein [bacterium]